MGIRADLSVMLETGQSKGSKKAVAQLRTPRIQTPARARVWNLAGLIFINLSIAGEGFE